MASQTTGNDWTVALAQLFGAWVHLQSPGLAAEIRARGDAGLIRLYVYFLRKMN